MESTVKWLPYSEDAKNESTILAWRIDAGTFMAFWDEGQEAWFDVAGDDITTDGFEFWAVVPEPQFS